MSEISEKELQNICLEVRRTIMEMVYEATSGHVGGALSIVEILGVLYYRIMKVNPSNPKWADRDRLVLSKGHAGPALYAFLAKKGFFPESELMTMNKGGTRLPSHVDRLMTPGIDMTAGALGQGLSAAVGMAIWAKRNAKTHNVFVILGDGELDEGQVWEAAMAAGKYKLDNLVGIVDYNRLQIDGRTDEIMPLDPLADKWRSFNWETFEAGGHNIGELQDAFQRALAVREKPAIILADTIKGVGVSFARNERTSHNMRLTRQQIEKAREDLKNMIY